MIPAFKHLEAKELQVRFLSFHWVRTLPRRWSFPNVNDS